MNQPSYSANVGDTRSVGISGYVLPSGYANFADKTQEPTERGLQSYIQTFPAGWDENNNEFYSSRVLGQLPEIYPNNSEVGFAIYTSGIRTATSTTRRLDLFDFPSGGASGLFSSNRANYEQASGDGRNLTASGFKDQGSIFDRDADAESFMFMNGDGYGGNCGEETSSSFNLNDDPCVPTMFKYTWHTLVKPVSVFGTFRGIFPVGRDANPLPTYTVPNQGVPFSGEVELHGYDSDPNSPDVSDETWNNDPPEFDDPGVGVPNPNPPEEE